MRKTLIATTALICLGAMLSSVPTKADFTTQPRTIEKCVAPTVTVATYTTGFDVGGLLTFTNINQTTGSGNYVSARIIFNQVETAEMDLTLFNAIPTASAFTDHTVPALALADANKQITMTQFLNPYSALSTSNGTLYSQGGNGIGYSLGANITTIYGTVASPNTPVFTSGATMQVCITVISD